MNQSNTQELFNRFKFFHPDRPLSESLMGFGFECGDGWFNLIWDLCEDIEQVLPKEGTFEFTVFQVKEKWGGLRFYTSAATDEIFDLIDEAESQSIEICEMCGSRERVELRGKSWVRTLCEECSTPD